MMQSHDRAEGSTTSYVAETHGTLSNAPHSSTFDTFIFDLDGTLLDTLPDLVLMTNQTLTDLGFPPRSTDEIRSFVGNGVKSLVVQAVPQGTSDEQISEAFRHLRSLFPLSDNKLTKPYPDMPETLAELKARGIKLGVLSNKLDEGVQQIMNQRLPGVFAIMHGESEGIPRKPDPAGLLRTIEELGSSPERTAYIGDSPSDIEAAHNAGAFAIGAAWGYHYADVLRDAGADAIATRPKDLLNFAISEA